MNVPIRHKTWADLSADEKMALVLPLIADHSYSEIATLLGAPSRNAVSRVVWRAKHLKKADIPPCRRGLSRGSRKKNASPRANMARIKALSAPEPVVPAAPVVPAIIERPDFLNLTLLDLTEHTCKWPVSGEKADTLFCGQEARGLGPYCPYHRRIAWGGAA